MHAYGRDSGEACRRGTGEGGDDSGDREALAGHTPRGDDEQWKRADLS